MRGQGAAAPPRAQEAAAPAQGKEAPAAAQPPGRSCLEGLGPSSRIDAAQKRLKEIYAPYYGTNAHCWARLVEYQGRRKAGAATDDYRELRREEMRRQAEAGQ
eukprot:8409219-Pyramimonas_sp.AAC.1